MQEDGIQQQRIHSLNKKPIQNGTYVIYWMQASQREEQNHALEYAVNTANKLNQPLLVFFGLTDAYPEAQYQHYHFMLEGLQETQQQLQKRNITMVLQICSPDQGVIDLASDASVVVCDRGYVRHQRRWRKTVATTIPCSCVEVETDVVVPIETVSQKEEYAAATIRSKIKRQLSNFLLPLTRVTYHQKKTSHIDSLDLSNIEDILQELHLEDNQTHQNLKGGTTAAHTELSQFITKKLDSYSELRNDPSKQVTSNMSPYLHFGQISPITIALEVISSHSPSLDDYLEELIIRRELSMNFLWYNQHYDAFQGLPQWSQDTLNDHRSDMREYEYSQKELEQAQTHDPYWNAAQLEMKQTGKMHGYMRMYWGKKIIEWSSNPEEAFKRALYLNNKYELDGRDPNGFTGVAWCFGKHDRPWKERAIFGKVRYMNDKGLERKFSIQNYVDQVQQLSM